MNAKLLAFALACSPLVAGAEPTATAAGILKSGVYLQNLDKSVRPQDDFYRHINGGWLATLQIPADRSNYGTFTKLQEDAERDLRDILEEAAKAKAAPGSDCAEGRRLLRELSRRSDRRGARTEAAARRARAHRRAQDEAGPRRLHRPCAAAVRRATVRVFRRRRREEVEPVPQHRDPDRPRHAGSRLLPVGRRKAERASATSTSRTCATCWHWPKRRIRRAPPRRSTRSSRASRPRTGRACRIATPRRPTTVTTARRSRS